jgi:hypothetical protein
MISLKAGQSLWAVAAAAGIICTLDGADVITPGSTFPDQLGSVYGPTQLPTTATSLYSPSGVTQAGIKTIFLSNITAGNIAVTFYKGAAGSANTLGPPTIVVPANGSAIYEDGSGWSSYDVNGVKIVAPGIFGYTGTAPIIVTGSVISFSTTVGQNENFTAGVGINIASANQLGALSISASGVANTAVSIQALAAQTGPYFRTYDSSNNVLQTFLPISGADPRAKFNLYNTLEITPTNYERGSVYFDNPNNAFRIETQNGGTGTLRSLWLQGSGGRTIVGKLASGAFYDDSASTVQVIGSTTVYATQETNSAQLNISTLNTPGDGTSSGAAQVNFLDGSTSVVAAQFVAALNNVSASRYLGFVCGTDRDGNRLPFRIFTKDTAGSSQSGMFVAAGQVAGTSPFMGVGSQSAPAARIHVSGNATAAAWGANGIGLRFDAATYTDSSSSGTVSNVAIHSLLTGTMAASAATTYTTASTLRINAAPAAGTNVTITNGYALLVATGLSQLAGNTAIGTSVVPTAKLLLGAGSATANTAPLQFTSGTLETTARAGVVEYDGNQLFATPSSAVRATVRLGKLLAAAISASTYTMLQTDSDLSFSAACTVTLLSATTYAGKEVWVKTTGANAIVSASANVVPITGGAAGTAILAATAGKWARLVTNAAGNWEIMASN